jgi:hypothetical protein
MSCLGTRPEGLDFTPGPRHKVQGLPPQHRSASAVHSYPSFNPLACTCLCTTPQQSPAWCPGCTATAPRFSPRITLSETCAEVPPTSPLPTMHDYYGWAASHGCYNAAYQQMCLSGIRCSAWPCPHTTTHGRSQQGTLNKGQGAWQQQWLWSDAPLDHSPARPGGHHQRGERLSIARHLRCLCVLLHKFPSLPVHAMACNGRQRCRWCAQPHPAPTHQYICTSKSSAAAAPPPPSPPLTQHVPLKDLLLLLLLACHCDPVSAQRCWTGQLMQKVPRSHSGGCCAVLLLLHLHTSTQLFTHVFQHAMPALCASCKGHGAPPAPPSSSRVPPGASHAMVQC